METVTVYSPKEARAKHIVEYLQRKAKEQGLYPDIELIGYSIKGRKFVSLDLVGIIALYVAIEAQTTPYELTRGE